MRETGLRPDHHTFSSMMSMYGKRGDRDAVDNLFQMSKNQGVEPNALMIDNIVLANINDERLDEAEQLVRQAGQMRLKGSRNFMWNVLLNAYALRRDVDKVSDLRTKMQEDGVVADNMTYASLMTALTVVKQPDAARRIMRTIMPRANAKRTALHYAIVMNGYLATQQYGQVFELYKAMLAENLAPDMSTQNVLLRAAAFVDKAYKAPGVEPGDQTELIRAQQIFDQILANLDPIELAVSSLANLPGPIPSTKPSHPPTSNTSSFSTAKTPPSTKFPPSTTAISKLSPNTQPKTSKQAHPCASSPL